MTDKRLARLDVATALTLFLLGMALIATVPRDLKILAGTAVIGAQLLRMLAVSLLKRRRRDGGVGHNPGTGRAG